MEKFDIGGWDVRLNGQRNLINLSVSEFINFYRRFH